MQSTFIRSLTGACAIALLACGATVAHAADNATGQAAEAEKTPADAQMQEAGSQGGTAEAATGSEATADDYSADTVVATVAGTPITLGELIAARRNLPGQFQKLPDEVLMRALIEQLTNQQLLAQAARKAGLDEKPIVRLTLKNKKRLVLANAYMTEALSKRITDDAIKAYYQKHYVDAEPVKQAHAAHILVKDKATAEKIEAKLKDGADFAELAAEYGTDGTASHGGDLGWFTYDQMVPPFSEAVFSMEPGTVSEPVKTAYGWHVIKLFDFRDRPTPKLDEIRSKIMVELTKQMRKQVMKEIGKGADVQIDREAVPASAIRADKLAIE